MSSTDKAVLLLSGGLDSGVLLAESVQKYESVQCLSFSYGARHNTRELECAARLASLYEVEHLVIDLSILGALFSSSLLLNGPAIPDGTYDEQNMRSTVVPFRNGILLSFAVGVAENTGLGTVLIGSHAGDHAVYPDCRLSFTEAFSEAAQRGTYAGVRVEAPFAKLSKREVVERGRGLTFDFALTWTCYKGGLRQCGTCAACRSRRDALKFGGGEDPTRYDL